ncbi:site-specific integrase [Pseudomonas sp. JS3066]|uniref:site-specific integrase n=1 Tax=Pseudomonas sp. JS3066 TaxID=3090665 RepID=UPI002E7AF2AB|nr:site-specific integrase [Pseudomonas sp. JS3066]WVK92022.1 site-specific integrase [Pseudomonas sp. JS3066]
MLLRTMDPGSAEADPVAAMLGLSLLAYACRLPSLLSMRWSDIDLIDHLIWIDGQGLPLTNAFAVLLEHYLHAFPPIGPLVFPGADGQPLSLRRANARIADAGGEVWTVEFLRETAALSCLALVSDPWVSDRLAELADLGADPALLASVRGEYEAGIRADVVRYHAELHLDRRPDWLEPCNQLRGECDGCD